MFKVDLHTHSSASPDGGISAAQYQRILSTKMLDYVAITDHNTVDFAIELSKQLGDKIIVGEEIMTTEGEIIGLFLTKTIPKGLTPKQTIDQIRSQAGIVYIPHPFETYRKGLHPATLEELASEIDIVEVCNGRAFAQDRGAQSLVWAKLNKIVSAASSDAHGIRGIGRTYTNVNEAPSKDNLVNVLSRGVMITGRPTVQALLYPKYHRIRKKLIKTK